MPSLAALHVIDSLLCHNLCAITNIHDAVQGVQSKQCNRTKEKKIAG